MHSQSVRASRFVGVCSCGALLKQRRGDSQQGPVLVVWGAFGIARMESCVPAFGITSVESFVYLVSILEEKKKTEV